MSKTVFPVIPDPTSDPRSLVECIKALTVTVNMLTGSTPQNGLGTGRVPVIYLDDNRPDPENVMEGDFWLSPYSQLFICSTKNPLQLFQSGNRLSFNPQTNTNSANGKKAWRAIAAAAAPNPGPEKANFELTKTSGGMNR